jgi:RND superfamily putative drug exporter
MQGLMLKLDALLHRRHRLFLAVWLVVLAAAVPFAIQQSEHLTGGGFGVPGSQSRIVEDSLAQEFENAQRASLAAVLVPTPDARRGEFRTALNDVRAAARDADLVELAPAAQAAALRTHTRAPERPVIVPLAVAADEFKSSDVAADLRDRLGIADRAGGVGVHLIGQGAMWAGLQDLSKEDLAAAESTGFPIVFVILLAVFGSLAAALLPVALGFVSVLVTGALIYALSLTMDMSVFVTNMASMVGIGVAVDYSLFVLARYREEIHAGSSPEQARAHALATSGVAVVFSGLTVIVSLAGLFMVNTNALRSMALGAILVVAVSLLASTTLLPVLIRLLGRRAYVRGRLALAAPLVLRSWSRRRRGSTRPDAPARAPFWERWTARVSRRPGLSAIAVASVLLVLAIPALSLKTGDGPLRQFPVGNETRVGFEAASSVSGPGESSPLKIVAPAAAAGEVRRVAAADPEIARVAPAVPSRDGSKVLLSATPRHDGDSPQAKALVERLRDGLPAGASVGGNSASQADFDHAVSGSMWKIALFVLALSYLVLLVLLRSVVLPLKAVVMNLLSVGAAYGVLVAVFQWGWVDGFLGFQSPGYLDTLTPPLVLAVVFGLSMDYEVFLLSRIRERFAATGDTRLAVAQGLASSARTITSAALIMVAVFAVFVGTGVPSIKQIGLGNAVAIAVDATLVRLVLVPAAMELLGKWNWWMPRSLGRFLPRTSFEELPASAPAAARG